MGHERDVDGDGDRRAEHVEDLDARHARVEKAPARVPVLGDRAQGRALRRRQPPRPDALDEPSRPAVGPPAGEPRGEVARPLRPGRVEEEREEEGPAPDLRFGERDAGPGTDGAREHLLRLVVEDDPAPPRPPPGGRVPLGVGGLRQPADPVGRERREEHGLPVPVLSPVEPLHAAHAEERLPNGPRHGPVANEPAGVVDEPGGLGAAEADGPPEEEPGLEQVRPEAAAAVRDEPIRIAEEGERAVGARLVGDRTHGRGGSGPGMVPRHKAGRRLGFRGALRRRPVQARPRPTPASPPTVPSGGGVN